MVVGLHYEPNFLGLHQQHEALEAAERLSCQRAKITLVESGIRVSVGVDFTRGVGAGRTASPPVREARIGLDSAGHLRERELGIGVKTRMSVECWLVNAAGEVLLLHVSAKDCPPDGFWQPLTGGIEEGESPLDALYREIYEETGIGAEDVDAHEVASGIVVRISDDLEVSKTLYHARVAATDIKIAPDEHDDYCWSSVADVPGFLHWESNRATWDRVLPQIAQGC